MRSAGHLESRWVLSPKEAMPVAAVQAFLTELHGSPVGRVEPLTGGFWSAAYAYEVDDRELVLRLSDLPEGFVFDALAAAFAGPDLPVPRILETGTALGSSYAISVRHHGRFLEEVEAPAGALGQLLAGLRSVPADPDSPVPLYGEGPARWRDWQRASLVDWPGQHTSGWRPALAELPRIDAVFTAAEQRVLQLLVACPERRDLVHGDLLHRNVLVDADGSRVTGVFSWKCAVRGDFLYDVAWCTFWAAWYPGILRADAWGLTATAPDLSPAELEDAAVRHHCYELAIGASHLGWYIATGDSAELERTAARLDEILERGPLTVP